MYSTNDRASVYMSYANFMNDVARRIKCIFLAIVFLAFGTAIGFHNIIIGEFLGLLGIITLGYAILS